MPRKCQGRFLTVSEPRITTGYLSFLRTVRIALVVLTGGRRRRKLIWSCTDMSIGAGRQLAFEYSSRESTTLHSVAIPRSITKELRTEIADMQMHFLAATTDALRVFEVETDSAGDILKAKKIRAQGDPEMMFLAYFAPN